MASTTSRTPYLRRIEPLWARRLAPAQRLLWAALVPPAEIYGVAAACRAAFWRGLRRRRTSLPLVSIGNLTVGGNGKTPFTLYLAKRLAASGIATAIVSRGWGAVRGRRAAYLARLGPGAVAEVEEIGDEPAMMAQSFAGPIAVARRRIDAIRLLEQLGGIDAVLLDDAFQHLRLPRDFDLLMVNAGRGFGNGWTLPAGPLRERLSALRRADAVVLLETGVEASCAPDVIALAEAARVPVYRAALRPRALVRAAAQRWQELPLALGGRRVLALSGLADASGFHAMLAGLHAQVVATLEFPDHHAYSLADWQCVASAAAKAEMVVTTEKDLVKLQRFTLATDSLYAVRLEVSMGADEQRLLDLVAGALRGPKSATPRREG